MKKFKEKITETKKVKEKSIQNQIIERKQFQNKKKLKRKKIFFFKRKTFQNEKLKESFQNKILEIKNLDLQNWKKKF